MQLGLFMTYLLGWREAAIFLTMSTTLTRFVLFNDQNVIRREFTKYMNKYIVENSETFRSTETKHNIGKKVFLFSVSIKAAFHSDTSVYF